MTPQLQRRSAVVLFVIGAFVLLFAEATWLRLAGSLVLAGYVVAGLFAIATPKFLRGDEIASGSGRETNGPAS